MRSKTNTFWLPVRILEEHSRTDQRSAPFAVPSFTCLNLSDDPNDRSFYDWTQETIRISHMINNNNNDLTIVSRGNERWQALMGSLTVCSPEDSLNTSLKARRDIRALFKWFFTSLLFNGITWLDERLDAMFEFSRHLSGLPLEESSKASVPSGTPGFNREGEFIGYDFFRRAGWRLLNKVPKEPGWGVEMHWAFSTGKRSKGFPTHAKRISALLKFRKRSLQEIESVFDREALEFGYNYVSKFKESQIQSMMNPHISHGAGATLDPGCSRQKGGRLNFGKIRLDSFKESAIFDIPKGVLKLYGPSGKEFDLQVLEVFFERDLWDLVPGIYLSFAFGDNRLLDELTFAEAASSPSIPMVLKPDCHPVSSCTFVSGNVTIDFNLFDQKPFYDSVPVQPNRTRIDTVDDSGAKARVIGVSEGCLVNLAHYLRTLITAVIRCDGRVPSLSSKKPLDKVLRNVNGVYGCADLTAATDCTLIGEARSLAKGLVDALEERKLIPSWLSGNATILVDVLLRPQVVEPPLWLDDSLKEENFPFTTKRSVPMGMPHSWVLLCLGQLFHLERAARLSPVPPKRRDVVVCGDDTATSGSNIETELAFRSSLRASGYELSSGTDVISKYCVQFTEQLWVEVSVPGVSKNTFLRIRTPFIKSLTAKDPPARGPNRGPTEKNSLSGRGSAMTSQTSFIQMPFSEESWINKVKVASRLFSVFCNYEIIAKAKMLDLPIYIPKEFGGLGFSHPDSRGLFHTRPFFLKGINVLIRMNQNIRYILEFRTLSSLWSISEGNLHETEARRLYSSWVDSVFEKRYQATTKDNLRAVAGIDNADHRAKWVDVSQINQMLFDEPLQEGDWEAYDLIKWACEQLSGVKWFPIKEALDHVEQSFRQEVLFSEPPTAPSVPTLRVVSKRVHKFYKNLLLEQRPRDWKSLKVKTTAELLDTLHWRQNLVLVKGSLPRLENFKSKW